MYKSISLLGLLFFSLNSLSQKNLKESDTIYSNSFFIPAAIKTISGEKPDTDRTIPEDGLLTRFKNNILTEFAFTSQEASILKNIRVKGGIIFPLGKDAKDSDITARIVIQILIGKIYKFGKHKIDM